MERTIQYTLFTHILVGSIAMLTGAVSIFSKKGMRLHRKAGSIYVWEMTLVSISGIIVADYRFNRFLLLIAFLSYYSVFSGDWFLKLNSLHKNQNPKRYDWAAGIINGVVNIIFFGMGMFCLFRTNSNLPGGLLSISFGLGGLLISYTNLKPLILRPKKAYRWCFAHIGNMLGGYIATLTAFLSTTVTRFELMNPFLGFALPLFIGIPLLLFWQHKIENSLIKSSN